MTFRNEPKSVSSALRKVSVSVRKGSMYQGTEGGGVCEVGGRTLSERVRGLCGTGELFSLRTLSEKKEGTHGKDGRNTRLLQDE